MTLHEKALALVKDYKRLEAELMDILQKIDVRKEFRELGFNSLFEYVVKALGLTESQAYALISVARKSNEVPELKMAVQAGAISVSQAKRITSVITKSNATVWIDKVQRLPQKAIEKEVAALNPKLLVKEKARYLSSERLKLELGVSEQFMKRLKRVQELMAQGNHTKPDMSRALEKALEFYIEKRDPLVKATQLASSKPSSRKADDISKMLRRSNALAVPRSARNPSLRPASESRFGFSENLTSDRDFSKRPQPISGKIPATIRRAVILRDNSECAYRSQMGKQRCASRQWLQIHHVIPRSNGGSNMLENLKLLCATHHRYVHEELG